MKRYDDNLNDNANVIIHMLKKSAHDLKWIVAIMSLLLIFFMMMWIFTDFKLHRLKSAYTECMNDKRIDEDMLNLEESIGYWFINTPDDINDTILYNFLIENNAWYPDILLKQAKIESANYTSSLFKNSNNIYGMKRVSRRQTTQSHQYNGYGTYQNWCLCVLDRLLWDRFTFNNVKPTREEYLKAMTIYAEDPNYINKIK